MAGSIIGNLLSTYTGGIIHGGSAPQQDSSSMGNQTAQWSPEMAESVFMNSRVPLRDHVVAAIGQYLKPTKQAGSSSNGNEQYTAGDDDLE